MKKQNLNPALTTDLFIISPTLDPTTETYDLKFIPPLTFTFFLRGRTLCHSYNTIPSRALRRHEQQPVLLLSDFRVGGHTVYDAVCSVFSSWSGARGHGTADLLTANNFNHNLRGKWMEC